MPEEKPKSPYLTTTLVAPSAPKKWLFCNRHNDLRRLFENIGQGMLVVVLGQRKIGKTFLLIVARDLIWKGKITNGRLYDQDFIDPQLASTLHECLNGLGQLDCVYLTLENMDSLEDIYRSILSKIDKRVPSFIRSEWKEPITRPEFMALISDLSDRLLRSPSKRMVLLMDEFERVLDDDEMAHGFFRMVNKLAEEFPSNLSVVLAGARNIPTGMLLPPYDTLSLRNFSLDDGDRELVQRLIREPARDQLEFDDGAVNRIIELSGGHPFFIQTLCQAAFEHYFDYYADGDRVVTLSIVDDAVADDGSIKAQLASKLEETFLHNYNTYLDEETRKVQNAIIRVLAHCPSATKDVLRSNLTGIIGDFNQALDQLEALGKITQDDRDPPAYQIEGEWARRWLRESRTHRLPEQLSGIQNGGKGKRRKKIFEFILANPESSYKEICEHVGDGRIRTLLHMGRGQTVLEELRAMEVIEEVPRQSRRYRVRHQFLTDWEPVRLQLSPRVNQLQVASWIIAIVSMLLWMAIYVYNSPALVPLIAMRPGSANIAIMNNTIQVVNGGTSTLKNADIAISFSYPGRVRLGQDADPITVWIECRKRSHRDIVIHLKEQYTNALEIIGEPKGKGFSGPYIERNLREFRSGTSQLAFHLRHGSDLPKEINLDVEITLGRESLEPQRGLLRMSVDRPGPYLEILQQLLTFLFGTGMMGAVVIWQIKKEERA